MRLPDVVSAVFEFELITSAPPIVMVADPVSETAPDRVGLRAMIEVPIFAMLVTVTAAPVPRAIETVTDDEPRTK